MQVIRVEVRRKSADIIGSGVGKFRYTGRVHAEEEGDYIFLILA